MKLKALIIIPFLLLAGPVIAMDNEVEAKVQKHVKEKASIQEKECKNKINYYRKMIAEDPESTYLQWQLVRWLDVCGTLFNDEEMVKEAEGRTKELQKARERHIQKKSIESPAYMIK